MRDIPTKTTDLPFLSEVDFTKLATNLATDKSIVRPAGREDDIEAVRLSLMSANANSVWLLGEEGSGKSTVISGLMQKIAHREVGPSLLSRKFFIFGAHAFYRLPPTEQFHNFDACLLLLNKQPSVLIFDRIDDFIDTAGQDSRYYANALIDGLLTTQAIIASNLKSRDRIHETSTGFSQTFIEQIVKSPNKDELLFMLRANRIRLEAKHDVTIPEETIRESARILIRYPGRAFTAPWPQGPLELLDRAAASVRMSSYNLSPDIMKKSERLAQLMDEKAAIEISPRPVAKRMAEIDVEMVSLQEIVNPAKSAWDSKYKAYVDTLNELEKSDSDIAEINSRPTGPNGMPAADRREIDLQKTLRLRLTKRAEELGEALHADRAVVSRSDIQKTFAHASGINLSDISGDERQRLLNADQELAKTVFGQSAALAATANIIRDARAGVSDPDRPGGVIMYTGSSGCGKTEAAKALAALDGGEGAKPITFPMNKFKDQSSASEFRGPAPGLIGYSENGPPGLSKVRQNPRSIVLFDEIEKAHDDLYDVIMTITDEGVIEDSAGNVVNFKDCILVFTTNVILPEDITETSDDEDARLQIIRDTVKKKINPKTGRPFFKPEFIERLDMIVMFDYLDSDAAKNILMKLVVSQNKTLEAKNYRLVIEPEIVDAMIEKFFVKGSNGRTVRQFYNRLVRPQITSYLLQDTTPPNENDEEKVLHISFDGENVSVFPSTNVIEASFSAK